MRHDIQKIMDDGKHLLRRLKLCCETFGVGYGGPEDRARICRDVGPFGDQKAWKRRPWMWYTARVRFVAGIWVFREAKMGAKCWSRVPTEANPLAAGIWDFVGSQDLGRFGTRSTTGT